MLKRDDAFENKYRLFEDTIGSKTQAYFVERGSQKEKDVLKSQKKEEKKRKLAAGAYFDPFFL